MHRAHPNLNLRPYTKSCKTGIKVSKWTFHNLFIFALPCFAYIALRYHVVAFRSHAQSEPIRKAFAPVDCLTRCKSSAAALRVYVTAMTPWSETEVKHATARHRCTLIQHLTPVFHRSVGMLSLGAHRCLM